MEYAENIRARMIRRMLGPDAVSATSLAQETGISQATLSRWRLTAASIQGVSSTKPPSSSPEPTAAPKRPQDWTALERAQAVLAASQLNEAELGEFLRCQGLYREQLEEWQRALEDALAQPRRPARSASDAKRIKELEREVARKDKALAETAALLVLKKKMELLWGEGDDDGPEERQVTLANIDEAVAAGATQAAACELLGLDERTVQRWRTRPDGVDQRRGPKTRPGNTLSDAEEAEVLALVTSKEFVGLSPHQLVAKLADMGIPRVGVDHLPAAPSTKAAAPSRPLAASHAPAAARARGHPAEPGMGVGHHVPARRRARHLLVPVLGHRRVEPKARCVGRARGAIRRAGRSAHRRRVLARGRRAGQLVLHADNGAAMKGKTMLVKLEELGIVPSFSRPRVSDDNPFPEALFRTLKYRPSYPDRPFVTLDDARRWVATFVAWYNDDHQHSGIRFVTPSERHHGHKAVILAHRHRVYLAARDRHPARWSRHTRDWTPVATVRLNPEHGHTGRVD
jgi:transposase InsO family protein